MEKKHGESGAKQRWNAGRKRDVVLRLMCGEAIDAVSREVGIEIYRLEEWRKKALEGMEIALKSREGDPLDEELKAAKLHIRELSIEVELLRRQVAMHHPIGPKRESKFYFLIHARPAPLPNRLNFDFENPASSW